VGGPMTSLRSGITYPWRRPGPGEPRLLVTPHVRRCAGRFVPTGQWSVRTDDITSRQVGPTTENSDERDDGTRPTSWLTELVARAVDGDRDAWAELVEGTHRVVWKAVNMMTTDDEIRSDAFAATWLR